MGLLGSLHCAGMCGPLACALPLQNTDKTKVFLKTLIYHLSRISVYILLGLVLGLLGSILVVLSIQKYLLFLNAFIFLILGFSYLFPSRRLNSIQFISLFSNVSKKYWSKAAALSGVKGYIALGLVNGIIPCGLVYTALSVALFSGTIIKSAGYMLAFGLGTLPLMLVLSAGVSLSVMKFKYKIKKVYPFVFIMIGLIMLFRALQIELHPGLSLWDSMHNSVMCH